MRKFVGPYFPSQPFREVVRVSLNSLQYVTLLEEQADTSYKVVQTKRLNFSWMSHYFSLDEHEGLPNQFLLRFELTRGADYTDILPPWLKVIRDVREEPAFKLSHISKPA